MSKNAKFIRTCAVCKTKRDKYELLRYTKSDLNKILIADPQYNANGKGIYACREKCAQKLEAAKLSTKRK